MSGKNNDQHLPPELAETLRRMDEEYQQASAGLPSLEEDVEFVLMLLRATVIDQVERVREDEGLTRADLARAMGVSRAYISKMLNEDVNFKLETIAKLAVALNRDIALRLIRKDEKVLVEPAQKQADAVDRLSKLLRLPATAPRIPYGAYRVNPAAEANVANTAKIVDLSKAA